MDEDLPIFTKELKLLTSESDSSKIIEEFLEKDNSGSFTYLFKKVKELNKLKSTLQSIFNEELKNLQYETLIPK